MKIIIILQLFLTIIFTGCTQSNNLQTVTIPNWYLNAPSNTSEYLYGIGEGVKMEQSRADAINNMAARLNTSVQSDLKSTTTISNKKYNKNILKQLHINVEKINFNNIKIIKNELVNKNIYILVQVDRKKLFNMKYKEYMILNNQIDNIHKNIDFNNIIRYTKIIKKLKNNIQKAKQQGYILSLIDNNFNYLQDDVRYTNILKKIEKSYKNTIFSINSNLKSKVFMNHFIALLTKNSYKIGNKSDIIVSIDHIIDYNSMMKWIMVKVRTTIQVKLKGEIIATKIISTRGRSSISKTAALSNASKQFKIKINNLGLEKILFG